MNDRAVFADTVEWVPNFTLHDHPDNPRQGDVGAVHESIAANGIFRPIYAQRSTRRILAGHHLRRGLDVGDNDLVPVLWVNVDDATALRIMLADNRSADLGSYDENALSALLIGIVEREGVEGLTGSLYDGDALDELLANDEPLKLSQPSATVHTCPQCGCEFTEDGGQ